MGKRMNKPLPILFPNPRNLHAYAEEDYPRRPCCVCGDYVCTCNNAVFKPIIRGSGVVHVGAHAGEEIPLYLSQGRTPILCFEPQQIQWTVPPSVHLVRIALGDRYGTLSLRIPHHLDDSLDTQSASGFALIDARAREIGWTPTRCDLVDVPMMKFSSWATFNQFQPILYSSLVIDVQGMELQVLKGFGEYLDNFLDIKVECSERAVYDGGADADRIVAFLAAKGFSQVSPIVPHGDIVFERKHVNV